MLKKLAKSVVPRPLLRRMRALLVLRNRKQLLKACEQHGKFLVEPVNRVEHYFHFIFDLSLPFWCLVKAAPSDVTFVFKHFGIFTERFQKLFPDHVEIVDDESAILRLPKERLQGMNPQFVHLQYSDIASFKYNVCEALSIDQNASQNKVLLIERMPPNAYFTRDAVKKGAGTSRRSIPNHVELQQAISKIVKSPYEFLNVQLENTSFEEQVRLFDRALLVIGQHGAGLANCIWMRHRSHVFELTHDLSLRHFQVIGEQMQHQYIIQRTTGNHAEIDVARVVARLLSDERLSVALGKD